MQFFHDNRIKKPHKTIKTIRDGKKRSDSGISPAFAPARRNPYDNRGMTLEKWRTSSSAARSPSPESMARSRSARSAFGISGAA